jgi:hypothetical protein
VAESSTHRASWAKGWQLQVVGGHRFRKARPGRSRFRPLFAIEATAGEPSNNKLAWRSVLGAVLLIVLAAECRLGAMELAMGEVELDRIVDAVRKEVALVPVLHSLTGLRASDWRAKAAGDKPTSRRSAPMARIRHVGEGRKRYR